MAVYGFKAITTVPTGKALVDTVLYRTQRKTPTVIRKNMKISRIRSFYMLKVKFTQNTIDEKLGAICDQFPKIDEIHPFYRYWFNIMYDKDHYKIALAQIHQARNLVDRVGKHYIKLLKHADSLFQCKSLKRAALGRMVSLLRKQDKFLCYLEQIRQHMGRLPSIDPTTRSIILTGFPSVGKSSFMNTVTDANVEVESWEFTTKSLFVGHMDYKLLRYQVIDTPGLLDQTLDKRNNIELQAITALAYLNAAIIFVLDPTGGHEYIKRQIELFESLKPFFFNKPLVVVLSKADAWTPESLGAEDMALIQSLSPNVSLTDALSLFADSQTAPDGVDVVRDGIQYLLSQAVEREASNMQGPQFIPVCCQKYVMDLVTGVPTPIVGTDRAFKNDGVAWAAGLSAELILQKRGAQKVGSKRAELLADGRLHIAQPVARDNVVRPPIIPSTVQNILSTGQNIKPLDYENDGFVSERLLELANGGASVYQPDERKNWLLENDEWKYDDIPYILDGKNILDFITVDEDIEQKLRELEEEEEELMAKEALLAQDDESLTEKYNRYRLATRHVKPKILGKNRGTEMKAQSLARNKLAALKHIEKVKLLERRDSKIQDNIKKASRAETGKKVGKKALEAGRKSLEHSMLRKRVVDVTEQFMSQARGNMSTEALSKTIRDDHKTLDVKDRFAYKLPNYSAPEHLMKGKMHGFSREWR